MLNNDVSIIIKKKKKKLFDNDIFIHGIDSLTLYIRKWCVSQSLWLDNDNSDGVKRNTRWYEIM